MPPASDPIRRPLTLVATCIAALLSLCIASCERADEFSYSRESPEAVIESARSMVESGRAELLPELVHAENERMRRLYTKAGELLGTLQDLAATIAERFPQEVSRIERLAEDGESGRATREGLGLGFSPDAFSGTDDPVNDAVQRVLSNPYGWLDRETSRLTTTTIDDRRVGVLRDGKPIFPPVGLVMERQDSGRWSLVLPTHLPPVQRILPKTEEETKIWLALLQVVDNALSDLHEDVERGRIDTLDRAVEKVAQKVMTVAPLVLLAYNRAREAREEAAEAGPESESGSEAG